MPLTYREAGVDIDAANAAKDKIAILARRTFSNAVLSEIGSFGGLFNMDATSAPFVLVASTDGVGTKLKISAATGLHSSVGLDLVSLNANDILCQGARPLFFLDYLALHKMDPELVESIVTSIVDGCLLNQCALLGGETAELRDMYHPGEYDLAGFIVGTVPRDRIITGDAIKPGDLLLGLESSGLHTNGYSLARRVLLDDARLNLQQSVPELGVTLVEELLRPHRSYVTPVLALLEADVLLAGIAHISGGGIPGNLVRILPAGCAAFVERSRWRVPPVFQLIQRLGQIADAEMFRTFNMGIGLILCLVQEQCEEAQGILLAHGVASTIVGRVVESSEKQVHIE